MALGPGDTFGRYTIVEVVGMGGMGQVLRALDNVLERNVALKIIRPDRVASEEALARFFREAKLAAKLTHANTLQIYDLGVVDGTPFIAMEHIEGKALTAYCGRVDISIERKLGWMLGVARGLAAAHRQALIHRDVKPANIMVTHDDVAKVVDFGLAKRTSTASKRFAAALGRRKTFRTEHGFALGTPAYMAPEQLDGGEIDARADQFAWGLTTYTLLLGRNPRAADPQLESLVRLDACMKGVSSAVAGIVEKALAERPGDRHEGMDAVVAELEQALSERASGLDARTTMEPPEPKPRGPRMWRFERSEITSSAAPFHVAAFSHDGKRIAAFGRTGLAIHETKWRSQPLPDDLPAAKVRCARFTEGGSIIVGGERSLAARILPSGRTQPLGLPEDDAVILEGVDVTNDKITFVGSRGLGGVIVSIDKQGVVVRSAPMPLRAVVRLPEGTLLACGLHGALVVVAGAKVGPLAGIPDRDLFAISRVDGGAVAVGAEGVAVHIKAVTYDTTIEDSRTTSTLTALAHAETLPWFGGDAWAASALGRVMKRDGAGVWKRMAPDWGVEPHVLAIWAQGVRVRAIATDASLIAGWKRE